MAVTTTNVTSARVWVLAIASTITTYKLTNYGDGEIEVFWKETAPAETDKGHVLRKYEGIDSTTSLTGTNIYLKGENESTVIITK